MFRRIAFWDRDHTVLAYAPVDGDLGNRFPRRVCEFIEHAAGIAIADTAEASCERAVGDHGDVVGSAVGQQILLDRTINEIVAHLVGYDRVFSQGLLGLLQLRNGEITDAGKSHFAGIDQA